MNDFNKKRVIAQITQEVINAKRVFEMGLFDSLPFDFVIEDIVTRNVNDIIEKLAACENAKKMQETNKRTFSQTPHGIPLEIIESLNKSGIRIVEEEKRNVAQQGIPKELIEVLKKVGIHIVEEKKHTQQQPSPTSPISKEKPAFLKALGIEVVDVNEILNQGSTKPHIPLEKLILTNDEFQKLINKNKEKTIPAQHSENKKSVLDPIFFDYIGANLPDTSNTKSKENMYTLVESLLESIKRREAEEMTNFNCGEIKEFPTKSGLKIVFHKKR